LVVCTKCGLMRQGFSSGRQARPFVSYAGGKDRFFQQRKDKEAAQVVDFLKIMPQLEKFLPEKGRLLEIGCAMGTLLNEIRKLEWEVVGVEPEEWTCELARNKYKLDVINSTFQEANLQESSFDVVLLLHVIEHIPNPNKGLSQIARLVRPGGFLVLETPRFDTLWFRLLKGRERSVIQGHYYYFTRETIRELACQSGFEVVQLDLVGRTVTLDRLCFYAAKFLDSDRTTSLLTSLSESLHLNKVCIYVNLRDMMRLYLRKVG
jgi:2-polyprenyl-3-methyl-5-hydroxy-6-metoxy-1,4-benzoquinol methylase